MKIQCHMYKEPTILSKLPICYRYCGTIIKNWHQYVQSSSGVVEMCAIVNDQLIYEVLAPDHEQALGNAIVFFSAR